MSRGRGWSHVAQALGALRTDRWERLRKTGGTLKIGPWCALAHLELRGSRIAGSAPDTAFEHDLRPCTWARWLPEQDPSASALASGLHPSWWWGFSSAFVGYLTAAWPLPTSCQQSPLPPHPICFQALPDVPWRYIALIESDCYRGLKEVTCEVFYKPLISVQILVWWGLPSKSQRPCKRIGLTSGFGWIFIYS